MGLRKGDLGRTHFKRRQIDEPLVSLRMDNPLLHNVQHHHSERAQLLELLPQWDLKLYILKLDEVTVSRSARVQDLKQAVMNFVDTSQQSQMGNQHISWKHVWASFCLCYEDAKLIEDSALLQSFGIKNNEQLRFEHHVNSREVGCHPPSQKHCFFHRLLRA